MKYFCFKENFVCVCSFLLLSFNSLHNFQFPTVPAKCPTVQRTLKTNQQELHLATKERQANPQDGQRAQGTLRRLSQVSHGEPSTFTNDWLPGFARLHFKGQKSKAISLLPPGALFIMASL